VVSDLPVEESGRDGALELDFDQVEGGLGEVTIQAEAEFLGEFARGVFKDGGAGADVAADGDVPLAGIGEDLGGVASAQLEGDFPVRVHQEDVGDAVGPAEAVDEAAGSDTDEEQICRQYQLHELGLLARQIGAGGEPFGVGGGECGKACGLVGRGVGGAQQFTEGIRVPLGEGGGAGQERFEFHGQGLTLRESPGRQEGRRTWPIVAQIPSKKRSLRQMKALLIALDTLRADYLGCYGHLHDTTPFLDEFAAEGAQFERMICSVVPTQPSYTTIFSGQSPLEHKVISHGGKRQSLPEGTPWLVELLARAGIRTAAVDNLSDMKPWFAKGYIDYINPHVGQKVAAEHVNRYALEWLEAHKDEDFFLFLHYWDTHTPYLAPESYRYRFYERTPGEECDPENQSMEPLKRQVVWPFFYNWHYRLLQDGKVTDVEYIKAQYEAELRYLDDQLAALFSELERLGLLEETLVIITADHGESLTEHELYFDHPGLYENNVHVPLIMHGPGVEAGSKPGQLVTQMDLAPTLLKAFGVEQPENMKGHSLLAEDLKGWPGRERVYMAECAWEAKWGVRTDKWKLLVCVDPGPWDKTAPELYDLENDPEELDNVYENCPQTARRLHFELMDWLWRSLGPEPDPMRVQLAEGGLPGLNWLRRVLEEQGISYEEFYERQKYI